MIDLLATLVSRREPELKGIKNAELSEGAAPLAKSELASQWSSLDESGSFEGREKNFNNVFSKHKNKKSETDILALPLAPTLLSAMTHQPRVGSGAFRFMPTLGNGVDQNDLPIRLFKGKSFFSDVALSAPPTAPANKELSGAVISINRTSNVVGKLASADLDMLPAAEVSKSFKERVSDAGTIFTAQKPTLPAGPIEIDLRLFGAGYDFFPPEEKPAGKSADQKTFSQFNFVSVTPASTIEKTIQNLTALNAGHISTDFVFSPESDALETGASKVRAETHVQSNPTSVQSSASSHSVVAQIIGAMRSDRAATSIDVRLDPPELGRVRIEFTMETADAVKAVLSAERSDTLDHMRRHISQLTQELRQAGFSSVNIEFSNQNSASLSGSSARPMQGASHIEENGFAVKDIVYLSLYDTSQLNLLV